MSDLGIALAILGGWTLFAVIITRFAVPRLAPGPPAPPGVLPADPYDRDYIMALADATRERIDCGCTFWDSERDEAGWVPCGDHLEALIRDVRQP